MPTTRVIGPHRRVITHSRDAGEEHEQLFDFLHCLDCDALALNTFELENSPCVA